MGVKRSKTVLGVYFGRVAFELYFGGGGPVSAQTYRPPHGNDADAVMEEVRAQDCHRDALDAMGIGS